jgi:predicted nuclease with TOPRIM domain
MREQLEQRVSELKAEQQKGQQMLAELEARQAELRQTLLRISGAIQVLEEMLAGPAVQNGALSAAEAVTQNGPVDARA